MILFTPTRVLRALSSGEDAEQPIFKDYFNRWHDDDKLIELDTRTLTEAQLVSLETFIKNDTIEVDPEADDWDSRKLLKIIDAYKKFERKLDRYRKLMANGDKKKCKNLASIPTTFEAFTGKLQHQRFFMNDEYEHLTAWVPVVCQYHNATQHSPVHVSFSFQAIKNGKHISKGFAIYSKDIKDGLTITEILEKYGLFAETEELNAEYERTQQLFADLIADQGNVYVGSGVAKRGTYDRYSWNATQFYFKHDTSKVVVDHKGPFEESSDKPDDDSTKPTTMSKITNDSIFLPVHPYINVFHLEEHIWLLTHVDSLKPYKFIGAELIDKLVLPEEHKVLIRILIDMNILDIDDIVSGKIGGSFIMATGIPGTGKTLTAEVFSEIIKKPLYKVQCAQLGLNVKEVEGNLSKVLKRGSRWGAILLIDEADVYVRARGNDIEQNAIVGTFLRTLEYYSGILFMTSNMGTAIDDAIMSRATAHLTYERPTTENLLKIWKILNKQFKTELTEKDLQEMLIAYPNLVGRDVKAILKLGKMYSVNNNTRCTSTILKTISKFVPNVATMQQQQKENLVPVE